MNKEYTQLVEEIAQILLEAPEGYSFDRKNPYSVLDRDDTETADPKTKIPHVLDWGERETEVVPQVEKGRGSLGRNRSQKDLSKDWDEEDAPKGMKIKMTAGSSKGVFKVPMALYDILRKG